MMGKRFNPNLDKLRTKIGSAVREFYKNIEEIKRMPSYSKSFDNPAALGETIYLILESAKKYIRERDRLNLEKILSYRNTKLNKLLKEGEKIYTVGYLAELEGVVNDTLLKRMHKKKLEAIPVKTEKRAGIEYAITQSALDNYRRMEKEKRPIEKIKKTVVIGRNYVYDKEVYYSTTDIIKITGVTRERVGQLREEGKLKGIKKGRLLFYPICENASFLRNYKPVTVSPHIEDWPKYKIDKIVSLLKKGESPKDIAIVSGASPSTIYKIKNQYLKK